MHVIEADPGEAPAGLFRCEPPHGDPSLPRHRQRARRKRIVPLEYVQRARPVEHAPPPPLLGRPPSVPSAKHHVRVQRISVVDGTDDSRFVTRRRARVPGAPPVDERDLSAAAPQQRERSPPTEGSGANHDDTRRHRRGSNESSPRSAADGWYSVGSTARGRTVLTARRDREEWT